MDVFGLRERLVADCASYVRSFIDLRDDRIGEAKEYLGMGRDTLGRWDRTGDLTARRHPGSRYRLCVRQELDAMPGQVDEVEKAAGRANRTRRQKARWKP